MKKIKLLLISALFSVTYSHVSMACPGGTGSVAKIVCLADSLKATLSSTQKASLELAYSYTNSQTWSNLPVTMQARIGIRIGDLTAAQLGIVKAIVSEISGSVTNEGNDEVQQLLLADDYLSANGGGTAYGSGQYYLCFNGTPTLTGLFSVKFGGHHLQIENTYNNGVMIGGTPHFEAVEPLSFTSGNNTYTPINQEKNALAAMFSTLSTTELASAKLSATFSDILMGAKNNGSYKDWIFPTTKLGLKVGSLTSEQKALVLEAIKTYVLDIDDVNAAAIIAQYTKELDETYISFSGNANLNTKNDYARIDGPGVWIEFTVQGGIVLSGNHYHSIWRDHLRDYGGAGSAAGVQTTAVGTGSQTSVNQINALTLSSAYPNPATENMTLQFVLAKLSNVKVKIFDVLGKLVLDKDYHKMQQGENTVIINLSELKQGNYHLVIEADRQRYTTKIIKE